MFLQGDSHRVGRVTATLNGYAGSAVGHHGIVKDNKANDNGGFGIITSYGVLVSGNTASRNRRYGISTTRVSSVGGNVARDNWEGDLTGSGFSLGTNVCTAGPC